MLECNYAKGAFDGQLTQYYFDGSIKMFNTISTVLQTAIMFLIITTI
jgi:hypothetical protein